MIPRTRVNEMRTLTDSKFGLKLSMTNEKQYARNTFVSKSPHVSGTNLNFQMDRSNASPLNSDRGERLSKRTVEYQ